MGIVAVPARLGCVFCQGELHAETGADYDPFLIKCNGCDNEMIDCNCSPASHGN